MYGVTIQEEYLRFCQDRDIEPLQELAQTQSAADFVTLARQHLGRPSARIADPMVLHYRALTFDREQVTRRVPWEIAQKTAIRQALAALPEDQREQFASHVDGYMVDTRSAGAYTETHDPNLSIIATASAGTVVAQSFQAVLTDKRIDWHSALKYGRLVRCYGKCFQDLTHVYAWAHTGRTVDATQLWDFLCEQAMWLGLKDPPLQEFVEVLKVTPCEPGSFDTWVSEELVPLVQFCTHSRETVRIATPLGMIVQWSPTMSSEVARGLYECGLEETKRLTTGLQRALSKLPQVDHYLKASLRSSQAEVRGAAAKWLTRCPQPGAQAALAEAYGKEADPITRHRLAAAAARHVTVSSAAELNLRKLMDECLELAADRTLPTWFRSMSVPTVRWKAVLKPTMGETVPRKVVVGMIAGAYRMRFQGASSELAFLQQHIDPTSWVELADFVLFIWSALLRDSFNDEYTKKNYVRNIFDTPIAQLPHKAQVMTGKRSPFQNAFEAGGLLEFLVHASPTNSIVRLWYIISGTSWHFDLFADAIAEDLIRAIGLRKDSAALNLMFDLDYVWHFGIREDSTSAGFEEQMHEHGLTTRELEWNALPHLGVDHTGGGYYYDGNGWWKFLLDEYFQILMPPKTQSTPSLVAAWRKSLGLAGLQELATRTSVRIYNLIRGLAALNTSTPSEVWCQRFFHHPLLRIAAARTVWQIDRVDGRQWFTIAADGTAWDQHGAIVNLQDGQVRVATCVNTPAACVDDWKRTFASQNRHLFTDQFVFAGTPAARMVDGYWRIDTSVGFDPGTRELLASECDQWAYNHGYVDSGDDPDRVGVYSRHLPGQVFVYTEFETHQMPVAPNTKTTMVESASYDLSDDSILQQPLVQEALRQQMYTDFLGLYSGQSWVQPPGVRCR